MSETRCSSCGTILPAGVTECLECEATVEEPLPSPEKTVVTPPTVPEDPDRTGETQWSEYDAAEHSDPDGVDSSWKDLQGAPRLEGYEIVRSMGAGGMGEVFLARDVALGRWVAIKTISAGASTDEASRARFAREARSMAALEHPHIARLYSFGSLEDRTQYLVMEYVDGLSLHEKLRKEKKLSIEEALSITRQVAVALGAAWEKKFVHRDIKPANILIDRKSRVRVVDFGLAKATEYVPSEDQEEALTEEGFLLGTPHYISPEQANGFPLDYGTDVYSLGIVLFEMLAGRRPFQGSTPLAIVSDHLNSPLPPVFESRGDMEDQVEALVERMTAKNRVDRPSYDEILTTIDNLIGPPSWESTMPIPSHRRFGSWSRVRELTEPVAVFILLFGSVSIASLMLFVPWLWANLQGLARPLVAGVLSAGLLLLGGLSAWAGFTYVSWFRKRKRRSARRVAALAPWAVALVVVLLSTNPRVFNVVAPEEVHAGSLLTFGPYPDSEKLSELRQEGYSGIISLLHPAVFPVETILLRREKTDVTAHGLGFASVPTLPWVNDHSAAVAEIERFLREHPGKYYIHAYVDRDRIEQARRVAERWEGKTASEPRMLYQPPYLQLERGAVMILGNGKYLIPFPTLGEMTSFYLGGRIREVVNLLDPSIESNADLIEAESRFLQSNGIAFRSFPLGSLDRDPRLALEAARYVKEARAPVAVHGFRLPNVGSDPATEAFLQAYQSNRIPLAPSLFAEELSGGPVEVVAPHIAVGPRPIGPEYGSYLARRGVRRFVYVGDPRSIDAMEDARITGEYRMSWRAVDPDRDALLPLLGTGGPFYLYGPELGRVLDSVRERYGPAIPGVDAQ